MYDALHRGRKYFCCYCLQVFITGEILKCHVNDFWKLMLNKRFRRLKKLNMLNSKLWQKNKITIYDLCSF